MNFLIKKSLANPNTRLFFVRLYATKTWCSGIDTKNAVNLPDLMSFYENSAYAEKSKSRNIPIHHFPVLCVFAGNSFRSYTINHCNDFETGKLDNPEGK